MTSFNVCDRKGLKIYRNIILKKVILSILLILLFALLSTSASAADFYSDYGQSEILYETVSSGSYNFEVNGMPASERWTEWYVNGSYTGEQYDDRSYWLNAYYDPDYTYSFSSGTTIIEANVYSVNADGSWHWLEYHQWQVTVQIPKEDTRFRWVETDPSPMIMGQQGKLEAKLEDDTWQNNDLEGKSVKFYVNGSYIGSDITDVQGEASYNYTPSSTDSFSLRAVFDGDSSYNSCDKTETIQVNAPPKEDTRFRWVETDPSPMIMGQQGKLEAKLEDDTWQNNDLEGKSVKFYVNGSYIGSDITDVQGEASYNYTPSSTDSFSLRAVFDGDSSYNSCDKTETIQVNAPPNNKPTTPGRLWIEDVTNNSAIIHWGESTDPDGDTVTYEVEYGENNSIGWEPIETTQNLSITLRGLQVDTEYVVQVRATDGNGGESNWNKEEPLFKTRNNAMTPTTETETETEPADFEYSPGASTSSETSLDERIPIILVHGAGSDERSATLNLWQWWVNEDYFNSDQYAGMFKVYRYVYNSYKHISENGNDFAGFVNSYSELQDRKVIIMAHSMGGLVVRYALNNNPTLLENTIKLITLGTPHLGSPLSNPCWVYACHLGGLDEYFYEDKFTALPGYFDLAWHDPNEVPLTADAERENVLRDVPCNVGLLDVSRSSPFTGGLIMTGNECDSKVLAFAGYLGNWAVDVIEGHLEAEHLKLWQSKVAWNDMFKRDGTEFTQNDGLVPLESAIFGNHADVEEINITDSIGEEYLDHVSFLDTPTIMSIVMDEIYALASEPETSSPSSITVPSSDSDGSYTVSWGASSTSSVTYVLEEATNSSFSSGLRTEYPGSSLSTTITGRSSGTTYYYRVKATQSGYTDSAWRTGSNGCTVTGTIPTSGTPSSITVPSSDSDGSYTVSWGASSTSSVTYVLEEATNSSFSSGLRTEYPGSSLSTTITGRSSGTTYYYRVKATRSGYADSVWLTGSNGCTVTGTIPTAGTPSSITVPSSDSDGSYTVSWGASSTSSVTYVLEEAINSSFSSGLRTEYPGSSLSTTITGRSSGTTYYYRVKATRSGYTDSAWRTGLNGCTVTGTIPTAGTPSSITVPSSDSDGSYIVSWGASSTSSVTYVLEEATNSSFSSGLRTEYPGSSLSTTITGRSSGTTYYYRVKATRSGYADSVWLTGSNGCTVTTNVKIAVVNPDTYRILKMGELSDDSEVVNFYSIASGEVADYGDLTNPADWTGVGEHQDFISSVLNDLGYDVDQFEASDMPAITKADYQIVIVQDPLRTNARSFSKDSENSLPDLLEYTTDATFLAKLEAYFDSGGQVIFVGDAVRLMEDGAGHLSWGKNVVDRSILNNPSQDDPRIPDHWLFIRGNPFCGVDRQGSGQYTVSSGDLLESGATLSDITLYDGNDLPFSICWSDTFYYPEDGFSLLSVDIVGSGDYVLSGATCNPEVYTVTVDETSPHFMGYTYHDSRKVFYLGSDSFFDYHYINNQGASHAGESRYIQNIVTESGKDTLHELVKYVLDYNEVTLADAISVLQLLVGTTPATSIERIEDINNDGKIGLEEVIYIMQRVSGLR